MNNEEQDVKKKIMLTVGACIFLIAAANALPLFFGITHSSYVFAMAQSNAAMQGCQMFTGLQRPLEFMGLQGRYITWAAITAGVGILGFMLVYAFVGFIIALVFTVVSLSIGIGLIMIKQRRGLYTKKTDKGVFIYAYSERI